MPRHRIGAERQVSFALSPEAYEHVLAYRDERSLSSTSEATRELLWQAISALPEDGALRGARETYMRFVRTHMAQRLLTLFRELESEVSTEIPPCLHCGLNPFA
jgi:hypothetical protein